MIKTLRQPGCRNLEFGVLGPNCLGLIRPSAGLNASFAPATPKPGGIGFLSQSGALINAFIDFAEEKDFGFSAMVSYGNEADLGASVFLDFLAKDKETKVLALYLEGLKEGEGRRFFDSLKKAAKIKPVVVLKGGKSAESKKIISSHTGALAGTPEIYKAVFEEAGAFEANTFTELILASRVLEKGPGLKGKVGIVTNAGALGVLIFDWCKKLRVPAMEPIDLLGDAKEQDYKKAVERLLCRKAVGGLIVAQTMQAMTNPAGNSRAIAKAKEKYPQKSIIACFLGGKLSLPGVEILNQNRILNCQEPKHAAFAMSVLLWKTKFKK